MHANSMKLPNPQCKLGLMCDRNPSHNHHEATHLAAWLCQAPGTCRACLKSVACRGCMADRHLSQDVWLCRKCGSWTWRSRASMTRCSASISPWTARAPRTASGERAAAAAAQLRPRSSLTAHMPYSCAAPADVSWPSLPALPSSGTGLPKPCSACLHSDRVQRASLLSCSDAW